MALILNLNFLRYQFLEMAFYPQLSTFIEVDVLAQCMWGSVWATVPPTADSRETRVFQCHPRELVHNHRVWIHCTDLDEWISVFLGHIYNFWSHQHGTIFCKACLDSWETLTTGAPWLDHTSRSHRSISIASTQRKYGQWGWRWHHTSAVSHEHFLCVPGWLKQSPCWHQCWQHLNFSRLDLNQKSDTTAPESTLHTRD